MPISEHIRKRTREWYRKAQHDLLFLENAPFDVDDPPTDTACRLAHMVAEYSLKGYLTLNKKRIIKTHRVNELLKACIAINQDESFNSLSDDCIELTKYKVEHTYPGPIPEEIKLEEAQAAIDKARRIYNFIIKKSHDLGYY